jgi:hypothetical protein
MIKIRKAIFKTRLVQTSFKIAVRIGFLAGLEKYC